MPIKTLSLYMQMFDQRREIASIGQHRIACAVGRRDCPHRPPHIFQAAAGDNQRHTHSRSNQPLGMGTA